MYLNIESSWQNALKGEFEKPYFKSLNDNIQKIYTKETVYPPFENIFEALKLCPFSQVKVVVLGQDPYHGENQAHGLCFSVPEGEKIPPSLKNIYKEIHSDIGKEIPLSGNLEHWAKQGVLLLNTTLTVRAGFAGSHRQLGWETLTDTIIKTISDQKNHVVFLLWGKHAKEKAPLVDQNKHLILTAPHPSPLSAYHGWFGSKHFSQTNIYLREKGLKPIIW